MSNLSELLPTGGGQNAVDFVASGTLSSGQTVVLKTDGTVEAVAGSAESVGSNQTWADTKTQYQCCIYNSNTDRVIIAYKNPNNSSYGTAVVGSISGSTITFGTPVVFASDTINYTAIETEPSSNHVVISYQFTSNYGYAIVGAVSGTSISFGSAALFEPYVTEWIAMAYDSTNNKYIIAFRGNGSTNGYGSAVVGTRSGTSISFGTVVYFQSSQCRFFAVSHDVASGKNLICFEDETNSSDGKAVVGTVSGTSISFGSTVTFETEASYRRAVQYSTASSKHLLVYTAVIGGVASQIGTIATVSGTSVSFSTKTTVVSVSGLIWLTYITDNDNFVLLHTDSPGPQVTTISISTGSIVSGSPTVIATESAETPTITYNSSANSTIISYSTSGGVNAPRAIVYAPASTNSADFIGITAEAISDTATGAVNVYGGINEAQTGLTIASDYYVQDDGSLSTTASSVKVGQAISATTINMMDLT
jgi:hypothetical protein